MPVYVYLWIFLSLPNELCIYVSSEFYIQYIYVAKLRTVLIQIHNNIRNL